MSKKWNLWKLSGVMAAACIGSFGALLVTWGKAVLSRDASFSEAVSREMTSQAVIFPENMTSEEVSGVEETSVETEAGKETDGEEVEYVKGLLERVKTIPVHIGEETGASGEGVLSGSSVERLSPEKTVQLMELTDNFCICKYSVDYRELQTKESILAFVGALTEFFSSAAAWKGEDAAFSHPAEYATAYWQILVETETILQAAFYTDAELLYRDTSEICRGVLELEIQSCNDVQKLSRFLDLEGISACGIYGCAYEIVFSWEEHALEPGGGVFTIAQEKRIGAWEPWGGME